MLLISNNAIELGMDYPKDAVIRVNTAWVNTTDSLEKELIKLKDYSVYLDYPIDRKKPPLPKMSFTDLLVMTNRFENIKYFAWSNAQDPKQLKNVRELLPERVTLVPKIETILGALYLSSIVEAAKTNLIMLDKEDLSTACGSPELYQHILEHVRNESKKLNITSIELKCVVFSD